MSKRSFRSALVIVTGTVVVLGLVAWYITARALAYPDERHDGTADPIPVVIDRGMAFPRIAERLADKGIIDKPRWFRLYAMRRGVTTKVRPGDYTFEGNMTPRDVLDRLLEGVKEVNVEITIPEGLHMLEVFELFKQVVDPKQLLELARDPEFLAQHGIDGGTIEGYLFPETYRFRQPSRPEDVLGRLIKQHRSVWQSIRQTKAREIDRLKKRLGWSDRDIVTMASIVEKEAVVDTERRRIAQVFMNRLTSSSFKPHRLDTDPTIRYGCTVPAEKSAGCKKWDPTQRLRRAQLDDVDNPYNTYQHEGLPPGPIANPGRKSLEATVDPDGSKYFFFVARDDHTHIFSRTRAEHERAVAEYLEFQRKKKRTP
jgi:UPF0755 protein